MIIAYFIFIYFTLDNSSVNQLDSNGLTPLIWAASYGQLAAVNLLCEQGAQVNYRGPNGETALMLACANGHVHVVRALLANGANIDEFDDVRSLFQQRFIN